MPSGNAALLCDPRWRSVQGLRLAAPRGSAKTFAHKNDLGRCFESSGVHHEILGHMADARRQASRHTHNVFPNDEGQEQALTAYALNWNRYRDIDVSVVTDDDETRAIGN